LSVIAYELENKITYYPLLFFIHHDKANNA
jgi:hypothetical protein